MKNSLDKVTIKGFKSIRELVDFEMKNLNVLIGGNGAGKSNLISYFKMMRALIDGTLNRFVRDNGGAGDILFNGRKTTGKMEFEVKFGANGFKFKLVPTPSNECAIEDEAIYNRGQSGDWVLLGDSPNGSSHMVEAINRQKPQDTNVRPPYDAMASWQIYHFHDTGSTAGMRNYEMLEDNKALRADASNIAAFLLKIKQQHPKDYKQILNAVRMVTPFFEDFLLEPRTSGSKNEINLSWTQKGSDFPLQPYHLSDGSIRFICLATALLQPDPPATIIIDEPELGLHPAAIVILAELIQIAATRTQVIIATQSPALIDQFGIEDIIVVRRQNGCSTFNRLQQKDFSEWLKSYSVGELWSKNVILGGPAHE